MLSYSQKRLLEHAMEQVICNNKGGINTRVLISRAISNLNASIPQVQVNRHHAAGMINWLCRNYNQSIIVKAPGYSGDCFKFCVKSKN